MLEKIIGFKTKDLYFGELKQVISYNIKGNNFYGKVSFNPKKYILASKKQTYYQDIFTKNTYNINNRSYMVRVGESLFDEELEVFPNKKRIKYSDAEKYLTRAISARMK